MYRTSRIDSCVVIAWKNPGDRTPVTGCENTGRYVSERFESASRGVRHSTPVLSNQLKVLDSLRRLG